MRPSTVSRFVPYGDAVIDRLAKDLTQRFGRGFGRRNVFLMRAFYLACPRPALPSGGEATLPAKKVQTASALSEASAPNEAIVQTLSAHLQLHNLPLSCPRPTCSSANTSPLPDEELLSNELEKTRREIEAGGHRRDG
jgi:hypothetical protein